MKDCMSRKQDAQIGQVVAADYELLFTDDLGAIMEANFNASEDMLEQLSPTSDLG